MNGKNKNRNKRASIVKKQVNKMSRASKSNNKAKRASLSVRHKYQTTKKYQKDEAL